ncbi:hypothetical protein [Deinococcus cellulosilyticus]|uniref:hypothetical protein n=2 Tax=Deinococcus cellulosilyticus TaxID=401558 RepID=UPI0036202E82
MQTELLYLITIPRRFDSTLVQTTRAGELALLDMLCQLQTLPDPCPVALARIGWLLFQLDRNDEARALLEKTPGMLALGYLARVLLECSPTIAQKEMFLEWMKNIVRSVDTGPDLEGCCHLDFACAIMLTTLQRPEEAAKYLTSAEHYAELIGLNTVLANAKFQQARALFFQNSWHQAAQKFSQAAGITNASAFLTAASERMLFWSLVLGGTAVPVDAPANVKMAHAALWGQQLPGEISNPEIRDVAHAWVACRNLLDYTTAKFPVHRGPRILKNQNNLLQELLKIEPNPTSPNPARDRLVLPLRLLGLALTGDPRTVDAAHELQELTVEEDVLKCIRTFALIQSSVWSRTILFSSLDISTLLETWTVCTFDQRSLLELFVTEFCPSVPFILAGHLHIPPRKDKPTAVMGSEGVFLSGMPVTYPLAPLKRYLARLHTSNDIKKLEENTIKTAHRLHFEDLAKPVQKRVFQAISEMVELSNVR